MTKAASDYPKFNLGDRIHWVSQSQGYKTAKRGQIIEVIAPRAVPAAFSGETVTHSARNHESYVVQVGTKMYWPRVTSLNLDVQ